MFHSQEWLTRNQPDWIKILGFENNNLQSGSVSQNPQPDKTPKTVPTVTELLQPPPRSLSEERIAEIEEEIQKIDKRQELQNAKIANDIARTEKKKREEIQKKRENTELSQSLKSLPEKELRQRIKKITPLLQDIMAGKVFSQKFEDFNKGGKPYLNLLYTSITDPFSDEQVKIILEVSEENIHLTS